MDLSQAAESSHRTKGLLRLTMACNENCPFCNVPAEDYERKTPPASQTDRELQRFIDEKAGTLTISGGEPTLLRKRLLDLVRRARDGGIPYVELQTNAVLIDTAYAQALAEAGVTSAFVSLLSHIPADHDHLAGLPQAFSRCVAGIDALVHEGIRVTLNPVLARRTQHTFADYVTFVATRLPAVRSISVSAVQPHGRAGRGGNPEDLLPDYAVLAQQLPRARAIAEAAGIELLNPYCGLPLCIGWNDAPERCVEAIEAESGGWRPVPGIENRGDKRQDAVCATCVWRTRCGGAWHAYWTHRGGSGIAPPAHSRAPWEGPGPPEQTTIDARTGWTDAHTAQVRAATTPTVWVWVHSLAAGSHTQLLESGCTDIALSLDPRGIARGAPPRSTLVTLREVRAIVERMAHPDLDASHRTRIHVQIRRGDEADHKAAVAWLRQTGVWRVV